MTARRTTRYLVIRTLVRAVVGALIFAAFVGYLGMANYLAGAP